MFWPYLLRLCSIGEGKLLEGRGKTLDQCALVGHMIRSDEGLMVGSEMPKENNGGKGRIGKRRGAEGKGLIENEKDRNYYPDFGLGIQFRLGFPILFFS